MITPACPVCREEMSLDILKIREEEGYFWLDCHCSIEGMYCHKYKPHAEQSLSVYKGMAVQAGIEVAYKRLETEYRDKIEALNYEAAKFMMATADITEELMYATANYYYCETCLPTRMARLLQDNEFPVMCVKCKKVSRPARFKTNFDTSKT